MHAYYITLTMMLRNAFVDHPNFSPSWLMIITWDRVGYLHTLTKYDMTLIISCQLYNTLLTGDIIPLMWWGLYIVGGLYFLI